MINRCGVPAGHGKIEGVESHDGPHLVRTVAGVVQAGGHQLEKYGDSMYSMHHTKYLHRHTLSVEHQILQDPPLTQLMSLRHAAPVYKLALSSLA